MTRLVRFSQELRDAAKPIWDKIFSHPFLVEMSEGRLPIRKFQFFLQQDYAYLGDFCRFLGMAVSKSETLEEIRWFTNVLRVELTEEMGMERKLASMTGLPEKELVSAEPTPTTRAYTSYLLKVGAIGTLGEIMTVMSPCPLTYIEIGGRMMPSKSLDKQPVYRTWCSFYGSKEARAFAEELDGLLDQYGSRASEGERERMVAHYLTASKYEYMFWDMAYKLESWMV